MLVFPCGSESKESACQCRTPGFDPWIRKIPWRREWLPTLVFLAGESHEQKSWAGYRSWGHKELDTTKRLSTQLPIAGIVFCFLYILLHYSWFWISNEVIFTVEIEFWDKIQENSDKIVWEFLSWQKFWKLFLYHHKWRS